jgi:hypothetical protein
MTLWPVNQKPATGGVSNCVKKPENGFTDKERVYLRRYLQIFQRRDTPMDAQLPYRSVEEKTTGFYQFVPGDIGGRYPPIPSRGSSWK